MKTQLEEPTIVAPPRVIDADAPPKSDLANMEISGGEFETKLKAAEAEHEAKEAAKKEVAPPKTDEPPKKEDAPAKGKTPLDVAPEKKKDEPPPVEEELKTLIASEPPANASQSSKANHAAMRKGLERANTTISDLRKENEELRAKPAATPAEIEERLKVAEQTAKDREQELERVAFERSPRFQKFVKDGEAELLSAKGYLEGTEINPNVIDLAARTVGAKRAQLLTESGMDQTTIGLVGSHLARADAINRERESMQEHWKETDTQWRAEQNKVQETRAAQIKANEDKVFQAVGKKVSETLAPFQRVEGNDEWNTGVDERLKEAQEYFDGKKPLDQTSQLIYEGIAGRVYQAAFEDLRTKYNDLVADNERTKAARPGAAATSHDSTSGLPDPRANPLDIAGDMFEANRARRG